ncbi:MAG: hypothetical protein H3C47_01110 [Candidatus Cloacimonetes bacterium]|nr:hypothetical protein [Candidatus Cloacimonadota bacterium]
MSIDSKVIKEAIEIIDEAWNQEQASLPSTEQTQAYRDLNPVTVTSAPAPKRRSQSRKVLDGIIWSEILKRKEF